MRLTDNQFKALLVGNYLGFQRGAGGGIPTDPDERIKQSKGLQAAYKVLVHGKGAAEAARIAGVSRQSAAAMVNKLMEEYYAQEGTIELRVRIPADKQDEFSRALDKIGGEEL